MQSEGSPPKSERSLAQAVPLQARGRTTIAVLPLHACLDGLQVRKVAGYEAAEPLTDDLWLQFIQRTPAKALLPAQPLLIDSTVSIDQITELDCEAHNTLSTPLPSELIFRATSLKCIRADIVDHSFKTSLLRTQVSAKLTSGHLHIRAHQIAKRVMSDGARNELAKQILSFWRCRNDVALRQLLTGNLILAERVMALACELSSDRKLSIEMSIQVLGPMRTVGVMLVEALCLQYSGSIASRAWHMTVLRRAYRLGELCQLISNDKGVDSMDAFLAGILTCVGPSALYFWQPGAAHNLQRQVWFNRHLPRWAIEQQWLGVTQQQIGSWVIQKAGLCEPIAEALQNYEQGQHNWSAIANVLRHAQEIDSRNYRYNAFCGQALSN